MVQKYEKDPVQTFRETKSAVKPTSPGINVMKGKVEVHQAQADSAAADKRHQHATKVGKTTLTPEIVAKVKSKVSKLPEDNLGGKSPASPVIKMATGAGYDDKQGFTKVG
jgi:hypothetical protein